MTPKQRKRFHHYVRVLRGNCHPKLPVRVRCRRLRDWELREMGRIHGYVMASNDDSFLWLVINGDDEYYTIVDTLTHEWAHCMVHPVRSHGKMWGKAFAQAYTVLEKEFDRIAEEEKKKAPPVG